MAAALSSASARAPVAACARPASRRPSVRVAAHTVTLQHPSGSSSKFTCENGRTLLEAALAAGVSEVKYLCRTGTCGVCAARVLAGDVTRDDLLLDDDQAGAGFALLCTSTPASDVTLATDQEKELHTVPYGL